MKDESIRKSLEVIAQRNIPENINLWPRLAARLERKDTVIMNPKWRLLWTVLLVLLGLFAVTGVAYAFYRYFNDPGLQAVSDAGLIIDLNSTAQATTLPPVTPYGGKPQPAATVETSQTLEGVTVTLDWAFADQTDLALGITVSGLAGDQVLDTPLVAFPQAKPVETRISSFTLHKTERGMTGIYSLSYLMRTENADDNLAIAVDIPLISGRGNQKVEITRFHFDVSGVPLQSIGYTLGQNYSDVVRANGIELRLKDIKITPTDTQALVCFEPPSPADWTISAAALQLSSEKVMQQLPPTIPNDYVVPAPDSGTLRCVEIGFPLGGEDVHSMRLVITELSTPDGKKLDGAWEFQYVYMPQAEDILQVSTATPKAPLASEVIDGDVTVTLEKAYADVNRMAFVVHIEGPQEGYSIYSAVLKDANGNESNIGVGIGSLQDDPTRLTVEFYPPIGFDADRFLGQLVMGITVSSGDGSWTAETHFDLDLPVYPAVVFDPMQTITANGVEMLLQRIKVTPSYTQVYLCYQKPSSADWMIGSDASLQIGEDTASPGSYSMLFDPDFGGSSKILEPNWTPAVRTDRCVKLGFPIGHHNQPESMTLAISELEQSVPEGIPEDQLLAARQKLLAQGVDMDWVTWSGQGGGGAGPVIKQKPEGMTDEQVVRLFYEALGYYHPGPWIFTLEINP